MLTDIVTLPALLERLCNTADSEAWQKFNQMYRPAIHNVCRLLNLPAAEAGDLTSDVLMKIVGAMRTFTYDPREGRFRGWVRTVVQNAVNDFYSKSARRADRPRGGTDNFEVLAQMPDPRGKNLNALSDSVSRCLEQNTSFSTLWEVEETKRRVQSRLRNPKRWDAFWGHVALARKPIDLADELGMTPTAVCQASKELQSMFREELLKLRQELAGNEERE